MRLVLDMNLSPSWVPVLEGAGFAVVHWRDVGDPRAPDTEIMDWARRNGCVVFTNDLDFGTVLALTGATGPSVVQLRTQDVSPEGLGSIAIAVLERSETALEQGALVVVDDRTSRVRILPLER